MSETAHTSNATGMSPSYESDRAGAPSGWAGWVVFAGMMLILLGIFQAIEGLVGLFNPGYYLVGAEGLLVNVDYNAWGWAHLIIGLVAIATGAGLLAGNMVARIVGIVVAILSAVVNLAFIAAYPIWSTIVIVIDVIVIYAIVVHGRELKTR